MLEKYFWKIKLPLCLTGILLVFYMPFLVSDKVFFYTDATFFLKSETQFLRDSILSGNFPLWNQFNYCGMPQIAVTFPTLFYLPDWLLIAFPFSVGLAFSMVFHQVLGAIGMYSLLKGFNYTDKASAVAALVFALSGYSFCLVNNHSLIAGIAWFVMALSAFRNLEIQGKPSYFWKMTFGALSVAFLLYSGRPEIIAPSLIILSLFLIWRAFKRSRESAVGIFDNVLQWQIRAFFIGSCLAMPQLLPVGEWLAVSRRASGLQLAELFLHSANWYDILSMIIGPALGDLRLHAAQFRPLIESENLPPYVSCAFLGPFVTTLALWGAFDSRWKQRWLAILVLIFSVLVSLGGNTLFLPMLIKILPALGVVRFPIKWLFLVVFCLAIFSAQGITALSEGRASCRVSATLWTIFAAFFLGLFLASGRNVQLLPFFQTSLPSAVYLRAERLIALSGLITGLIGFVISTAAHIMQRIDRNDKALPITLILLMGMSLVYSAFAYERVGAPSNFWIQPSYAANQLHLLEMQDGLMTDSRVLNLCLERFTAPPSYLKGDVNTATQMQYQYHRQLLKPNSNIEFGIPETLGFEGTTAGDYYHAALSCYLQSNQSTHSENWSATSYPLSRFCAITSTDYVITQKYRVIGTRLEVPLLDDQFFEMRHESESMNVRIYRVRKSLPRCYLANVCRLTRFHNQVLESLVSPNSGDFDPLEITYIEGSQLHDSPTQPVLSNQISFSKAIPAAIRIDQPEHIRIEVNSNYPTTLVLTDRNYAGWVAALDGVNVPILTANGFMRAAEIPTPGKHIVDFTYQPESLKLGLIIAGLAIFLTLYLGLTEFKQKQRAVD